jgi:hypothetical protein
MIHIELDTIHILGCSCPRVRESTKQQPETDGPANIARINNENCIFGIPVVFYGISMRAGSIQGMYSRLSKMGVLSAPVARSRELSPPRPRIASQTLPLPFIFLSNTPPSPLYFSFYSRRKPRAREQDGHSLTTFGYLDRFSLVRQCCCGASVAVIGG